MRASWLGLALGGCLLGGFLLAALRPAAPMVLAGVPGLPMLAGMTTLSAPSSGWLAGPAPAGPKEQPKPPKAASGQGKRGQAKQKPAKVAICHRTDSAERPNKTITVSERAWKAHQGHGDTSGACPG
jgi:hypothetical protein